MALGWAIYGSWNWWTWWLHEILEHEMSLYIFFWTRDSPKAHWPQGGNNSNNTNVFLHTWTRDFLNTNNSNNTNIFWHTDLTHGFLALDVWTRILRITRILFGTRISFFLHTDLTNLTDFEPSARCEWQLVVVIDSLWLLVRCGYWLVMVIGLLWLLARYGYWLVMF